MNRKVITISVRISDFDAPVEGREQTWLIQDHRSAADRDPCNARITQTFSAQECNDIERRVEGLVMDLEREYAGKR